MVTSAIDLPDWIASVGGPTQEVFATFITTTDIPVAQFQSVMIRLQNLDNTTPLVARYSFRSAAGLTVDQGVLSTDATTGAPTWSLPVLGPTLRLENLTGGSIIARVTGLPIARNKRMMFDYLPWRTFGTTVPNGTASLTQTPLPGNGISLDATLPDLSSYNGLVTYIVQVNPLGGAGSWTLNQQVQRLDGTTVHYSFIQITATALLTFQGGHPFGFCSYTAINFGALTANAVVSVTVIPSETV